MNKDCARESVRIALTGGLVLLLTASRGILDAGRPRLAILQCRLMFLAWPWRSQSSGCKWPCMLE